MEVLWTFMVGMITSDKVKKRIPDREDYENFVLPVGDFCILRELSDSLNHGIMR